MEHLGELLALFVAVLWTATALFADVASHRLGAMTVNIIRLTLATIFIAITLMLTIGSPYPVYAGKQAWFWLGLSALVGYTFGDFCLFNSYLVIGARFGQLFMTLAPPTAAIAGWILLGERMEGKSWLAMAVTLSGIAVSILSKKEDKEGEHKKRIGFTIPVKGVLLGLGAGIGQGVGLVLSKIGMNHYSQDIPADAPRMMESMMPFAATMMRAMVGALGFIAIMGLQKNLHKLVQAPKDRKGFSYAMLTTFFGPFLGVGFSLMAVQYTNAGIAQTLMALTPVLIILPYCLIYKQKVKFREMIGVTLSMAGVAMFFLL
ncbi:MAG: DMT family transporter [Bacteroidales bacterium]|nr:DMT family transporter [Bacteroidales bacterium]